MNEWGAAELKLRDVTTFGPMMRRTLPGLEKSQTRGTQIHEPRRTRTLTIVWGTRATRVLLTSAGQELAAICGSNAVEGFFDFVCARWKAESLIAEEGAASAT